MDGNKLIQPNGLWVYVISLVETSLPMEWFFAELQKYNREVVVVFLNPHQPHLMDVLTEKGYRCVWMKYDGKKSLLNAFLQLYRFFKREKPSVVHAHLFDACLVALPAAALAAVRKRVHTRHHASHHHFYFPHAVKYDKFINYWSTDIFAISQNVKDILVSKEGVTSSKVSIVHHGFDFNNFKSVSAQQIADLKIKYRLDNRSPIVGVIARYTHWKGIQYIIPAFKNLLSQFPDAVLVLANAKGDFESEIKALLSQIPSENYREIVFEKDSAALYKLFDVFVHVPIDDHSEAFGQVYVEAMVAEVPCIYTISGIASEFVEHRENALVVDYMNSNQIQSALIEILESPKEFAEMAKVAHDQVLEIFDITRMVNDTVSYYGK